MLCCFGILKKSKKGQIFPILIVIIVILIIAALISANLGKVSLDRLSCIQAADAGALAGISDFTCGYNKASWMNLAMLPVSLAIQTYLAIPQCSWCYPYRHMWAVAARYFNLELYSWANTIVRGYSESARKDAYYYSFINAGIDDKYRWDPDEGQYRDKPHEGETWEHWMGLKSAFNKWWNEMPSGWHTQPSLTYTWHNGSKEVTVYCDASPPESLRSFRWMLIGIYLFPISKVCVCCLPLPVSHGPIHAFLEDPHKRWVRMKVERSYMEKERDLGFWRVRHPTTQASARTEMYGSIWSPNSFDFKLTE